MVRKIVQTCVRRPWIPAIGVVALIGAIIFLGGSNNESDPAPEPVASNSVNSNSPNQNDNQVVAPPPIDTPPPVAEENNETAPQQPEDLEDIYGNPVPQQVAPAPDPHDYDPQVRAEHQRQQNMYPILQELPYAKQGIFADIVDLLPNEQLVIKVTYSGKKDKARATWNQLLRSLNDSGSWYTVVFEKR